MREQTWLDKLLSKQYRWKCRLGWHEWSWTARRDDDGAIRIDLKDSSIPPDAKCAVCGRSYV